MVKVIMDSDFIFPKVFETVMQFVKSCDSCSSVDLRRKKHVVKHPIVPKAPMEHCQLDCLTYTKYIHGNSTASNLIDLFSKFVHSVGTINSIYYPLFKTTSGFGSHIYLALGEKTAGRVLEVAKQACKPGGPFLGRAFAIYQSDNGSTKRRTNLLRRRAPNSDMDFHTARQRRDRYVPLRFSFPFYVS